MSEDYLFRESHRRSRIELRACVLICLNLRSPLGVSALVRKTAIAAGTLDDCLLDLMRLGLVTDERYSESRYKHYRLIHITDRGRDVAEAFSACLKELYVPESPVELVRVR